MYPDNEGAVPPLVVLVGRSHVSVAEPVVADVTATVALCDAEVPLASLQVSVYVVVAVSPLVLVDPLVDSLPDQPPDAVQEVASSEDHFRVETPPFATLVGLAVSETVGADSDPDPDTVTVTDLIPQPSGPGQPIL